MRYDSLTNMADKMMMYKYIIKNVARRHGKTVTLMPKPLFQDNGSGMHTHQSIWKEGRPLFAGTEYAGVSQLCIPCRQTTASPLSRYSGGYTCRKIGRAHV